MMPTRVLPLGHREGLTWWASRCRPDSVLEIGVREGDSLRAILDGHAPARLAVCDDWGSSYGGTGRGSERHIERLLHDLEYGGQTTWLSGDSASLVPALSGTWELVHVDGNHSTEHALADLRNGWSKAPASMVVHDMIFSTVRAAAEQFMDEQGLQLSYLLTGDTHTGIIQRRQT